MVKRLLQYCPVRIHLFMKSNMILEYATAAEISTCLVFTYIQILCPAGTRIHLILITLCVSYLSLRGKLQTFAQHK